MLVLTEGNGEIRSKQDGNINKHLEESDITTYFISILSVKQTFSWQWLIFVNGDAVLNPRHNHREERH